eukprot:m.126034 g.126034  ORF g.126034 m.126034 type:complete len:698 (-) comp13816_c0_seq1:159-2252(-)
MCSVPLPPSTPTCLSPSIRSFALFDASDGNARDPLSTRMSPVEYASALDGSCSWDTATLLAVTSSSMPLQPAPARVLRAGEQWAIGHDRSVDDSSWNQASTWDHSTTWCSDAASMAFLLETPIDPWCSSYHNVTPRRSAFSACGADGDADALDTTSDDLSCGNYSNGDKEDLACSSFSFDKAPSYEVYSHGSKQLPSQPDGASRGLEAMPYVYATSNIWSGASPGDGAHDLEDKHKGHLPRCCSQEPSYIPSTCLLPTTLPSSFAALDTCTAATHASSRAATLGDDAVSLQSTRSLSHPFPAHLTSPDFQCAVDPWETLACDFVKCHSLTEDYEVLGKLRHDDVKHVYLARPQQASASCGNLLHDSPLVVIKLTLSTSEWVLHLASQFDKSNQAGFHPNIARLYSVYELGAHTALDLGDCLASSGFAMVMEYVPSGDASDHLDFCAHNVVSCARDIANALQHMHTAPLRDWRPVTEGSILSLLFPAGEPLPCGIQHCDVKHENILVSRLSQDERVTHRTTLPTVGKPLFNKTNGKGSSSFQRSQRKQAKAKRTRLSSSSVPDAFSRGTSAVFKLVDFGGACVVGESPQSCTLQFSAPEFARGVATSTSDVFCLAATVSFFSTGRFVRVPTTPKTTLQTLSQRGTRAMQVGVDLLLPSFPSLAVHHGIPFAEAVLAGLTVDPVLRPDMAAFITHMQKS